MQSPDVVIAGAGLIGLACALECERRGMRVVVLEKGLAGQQASWAAAGMLAAHDPSNPPELTSLSEASLSLYSDFLGRLAQDGGLTVPIQTQWTLEQESGAIADAAPAGFHGNGFRRMKEQSLNPRHLVAAVSAAVRRSSIVLHEGCPMHSYNATDSSVEISTPNGSMHAGQFLDCTGAWSRVPVRPVKGQMLRVNAPGALSTGAFGNVVIRTGHFYLVPRLDGTVVIGATVEDAGFDKTIRYSDLDALRAEAAALIPALQTAPEVESWAGLRPGTPDSLPLLGQTGPACFVAAGHFRNGILLAPGTALLMGELLAGQQPRIDLGTFSPDRFNVVSA
ncbi:MAG: NAD(P)/FAD-dependent oxidoreductase [Janthinobacterium lividum]